MMNSASADLLRTISEVLDIRSVLPRVSEIANHLLPHDCLNLVFGDRSGHFTRQARWTESLPEFDSLAMAHEDDCLIAGDLAEAPPVTDCDPPDFVERVVAAGYRSLLTVRCVARRQVIGMMFFSKR